MISHNQNELGGSCYEDSDSGLSRFGREVVREMNRTGILVDLSHVGNKTSIDAIEWSQKPVGISHANADSLFAHLRNKSDDVLRALAQNGGVLGCATYRNITGPYFSSSVEKWAEMIARTVDIVGIDHVGIGTDNSHNSGMKELNWMRMGRWTKTINYGAGSAAAPGKVPPPDWFTKNADFSKISGGLKSVGFNAEEGEKILNGNWLRVYDAVFPRKDTERVAA